MSLMTLCIVLALSTGALLLLNKFVWQKNRAKNAAEPAWLEVVQMMFYMASIAFIILFVMAYISFPLLLVILVAVTGIISLVD